ncbi:DUF1002 domain-containing protein [Staphylococcus massiliensis CCUG 55927]|uniref:Extracellular protein n=2 Tax=Staphylococcus massiliensis TaxID=555791 RepID=K9AVC6_9STAP|nr:DUF1002 domain-containing protein [Staphylococcus massiliensis]EKU50071.1 hypothetical protein C273_02343 [Staphylococcus massiliensis S46]PNZ99650.1 DUF1002 domain-containing protein [Staphylococcus massiliensis CCUG 55927]
MYKKWMTSGLVAAMLLVPTAGVASAEELKEDIFVHGADLNQSQLNETKSKLNVKDNTKTYNVTTSDVAKYTGNQNLAYIHSSVTIHPKSFRKGISVEITTPENITKVTKAQYTNAAITAGIQNADIKIASVDQVTGEGALSGIYKAYEAEGHTLDMNDIQNSQSELNQLSNISQQNQGQNGYSDEALNHAVADMKREIAQEVQKNQNVSNTTITNIVNTHLENNGLINILSDNQINQIINIMNNVANSKAITEDPKAFEQQAKDLTEQIKKSSGDLLEKAKSLDS